VPGRARLIVALFAGCLPPARTGPQDAVSPQPIRAIAPRVTQEAIQATGTARALHGLVRGTCDGIVRMEVLDSPEQGPLTVAEAHRDFHLFVPDTTGLTLRYGCDADEDGIVEAADVVTAPMPGLGGITELLLPTPADSRLDLVGGDRFLAVPGGPDPKLQRPEAPPLGGPAAAPVSSPP
jgi:hypothetical protein